ncbi:hypothetical protein K6Q96_08985 [Grimontia kaedaensis]|uniref:MarR family transcriptional regulator n=1 Tax=Grimontia kaedaensis TaxID=2872157 RepID=A0ABY4WPT9_9GAMM|nr:helix-turn-helix domain-containing protein [Grimontia kaedaensis]USH01075.1 hypothetical protein K6Q96_08985 [Grimontia kaedaensis]
MSVLQNDDESASIKSMKQIISRLKLADFMDFEPNDNGTVDGWGVEDGEFVAEGIAKYISGKTEVDIFEISLEGVRRIDASFPREAFLRQAQDLIGKKGFYVTNVANEVLLDNIRAGADKLPFPIHAECNGSWHLLGPEPKRTQQALYEYVMNKGWVAASDVAEALDLKINNASNKLKELVTSGLLMRKEGIAESGGVEYYYFPIKK